MFGRFPYPSGLAVEISARLQRSLTAVSLSGGEEVAGRWNCLQDARLVMKRSRRSPICRA